MKSIFDTKPGSEYIRAVLNSSQIMILSLLLVFLLSFISSSAWSFETYYGRMNDHSAVVQERAPVLTSYTSSRSSRFGNSSSTQTESQDGGAGHCRALLASLRHASPHNALDRNQPSSAGKAAALGLIFGVRFALAPSKTASKNVPSQARFDVWEPNVGLLSDGSSASRSALAVAAYRQCQKQKALQALNILGSPR